MRLTRRRNAIRSGVGDFCFIGISQPCCSGGVSRPAIRNILTSITLIVSSYIDTLTFQNGDRRGLVKGKSVSGGVSADLRLSYGNIISKSVRGLTMGKRPNISFSFLLCNGYAVITGNRNIATCE